jgi:hypothetical protein
MILAIKIKLVLELPKPQQTKVRKNIVLYSIFWSHYSPFFLPTQKLSDVDNPRFVVATHNEGLPIRLNWTISHLGII